MAVFDSTFLVYLFDPDANPPNDPNTGNPVSHLKERIDHLVAEIERSKDKVVIPTPCLSEYLIKAADAGVDRLQFLQSKGVFQLAEFGTLAAVELAHMNRAAIESGDKKGGLEAPWQKIKLDRQIVAIAKVAGEGVIYSGDPQLHAFAAEAGIKAVRVDQLEIPPEAAQVDLGFPEDSDTGP